MTTNFFEMLSSLSPQSDWTIVIKKVPGQEIYCVSVHMTNNTIKESAIKVIPPKNIKGDIKTLDTHFFEALSTPIKKTDDVFTNCAEHEKALENAKKQSKAEEEIKTKEKREKASRHAKFEEIMKKAADLQTEDKIGEAIGILQQYNIKEYPELEKKYNDKLTELKKLHAERTLF